MMNDMEGEEEDTMRLVETFLMTSSMAALNLL